MTQQSDDPALTQRGPGTTIALSVMMFLQFFLWGAWFVTLSPYMNALRWEGIDIGNAYTVAPIAAIIAPFFLGIVADRYFASQRVMAVLHILGGVLLLLAPMVAVEAVPLGAEKIDGVWMLNGDEILKANPWPFIGILFAHMLCYMPTLGLSNTIAFHAMNKPEKQFPIVRVWGTVGWIIAGITVGLIARQLVRVDGTLVEVEAARAASPYFFYVAGGSGILLGLFSFFLPHTPAPSKGMPFDVGAVLGRDTLALLKERSFAVFIFASLLICIPLAAYYSFAATYAGEAGMQDVPIKMTFGQMSEILFMLVMPLMFARLGVKWMLAVGMLAWVLRYGLFAAAWDGPGGDHVVWMILGGIILHGICYDFFFVTGQIYTEQKAPKQIRAQAQGFLVLVTQGVGMLIGNQVFGRLVDANKDEAGNVAWQTVWAFPAGFALLILVVFVLLFKERPTKADPPA